MSKVYIATSSHPDLRNPTVVEEPYRRQRISTLKRKYANGGDEIGVWRNGEDISDTDLWKNRVRPGDKITFAPRVGAFAALWAIGSWLFTNVALPAAYAYAASYAYGEIFGQDLPDSDKSPGGQSFAFNPKSAQVEGGAVPMAYGRNMHHGTIVARWTDVDATGDTSEILYLLTCFGEGPTKGIVAGEIYLNDRPITDYSGVTTEERLGTWNQTAMTNFPKTKLESRVDTRITTVGGPVTVTMPRKGFDDIEYTIWFRDGIWYTTTSGHFKGDDFGVTVEIAEVGTESWTQLLNSAIGGSQRAPIYKAYSVSAQGFSVDRTKQYKLKYTKHRADNTSPRRPDHIGIKSVRGVVDIAFKRPGKALLGIKAVGTSSLSGDIDVKVVRDDRIVNNYDGADWTLEHGTNRAFNTYSFLTQPCITGDGDGTAYAIDHYEGFAPAQIDTAFIYEWSQLTDDLLSDGEGGTEELLPLHHIFDTPGELWQTGYEICQIGRAHLVWQGNLLTGWIDKAWTDSEDLITAENIVAGSWKDEWTKQNSLAGSLIVNYQDASMGYKRIPLPIHNSSAGRYQNTVSVEAIGLKTRGQASRVGWFALKRNELIRTVNAFTMHKDALRYKVGDVHPIQRNKPNWGTSYRVRRYVSSDTIQLDRTVVATAGNTVYVRAYNAGTGDVAVQTYTVKSISGSNLTITGTFSIQPVFDDIVAVGSSTEIKKHRIKSIEWRRDHYFDIVVENYDSNLYSTDATVPTIPYSGVTPAAVRNSLDRYMTSSEVAAMIAQHIPPPLDIDIPMMSNITWNNDTPDGDSVSWSATTVDEPLEMRYKGTSYEITADDTSDKYIYWTPGATTFATTDSDATMTTQLLAGVFMVCVNNEGTARPAQAFPLLWGGLIQAGTITAALGQIADLTVGTLKIIDDAVTVLSAAESAQSYYLYPSPDGSAGYGVRKVSASSPSITAIGAPILVSYTGSINGSALTASAIQEVSLFSSNDTDTKHTVYAVTLTGTNEVVITTTNPHGLSTNNYVWTWGLGGTTECNNGIFKITVIDPSAFSLNDTRSDWFTAWTSGGYVWKATWQQVNYTSCAAYSFISAHTETLFGNPVNGVTYEFAGAIRNNHASLSAIVTNDAIITAQEVKK